MAEASWVWSTLKTAIVWAGFESELAKAGQEAQGITKEQDPSEGQGHETGNGLLWTWCLSLRKRIFSHLPCKVHGREWPFVHGSECSYVHTWVESIWTVDSTWACRLILGIFHLWIVQGSWNAAQLHAARRYSHNSINILLVAFANLPWKITSEIKCNADSLWKLWWMSCHL